jgi:shikimate dehydrogenase
MSAPSRFAVFGHPIAHSLSPAIHRAFAKQAGIALDYRAIDVAPADFAVVVRAFFAAGGAGANVTLPHKGAALALADGASVAARRSGSANVLTRRADGSLAADNTDGIGLVRDLSVRHGYVLSDRRCLLLGAGGAARGVAGPLLDAGLAQLVIVNRSPAAAIALADAIDDPQRAQASAWETLATLGRFDVIVHATAAGVLGQLQSPDAQKALADAALNSKGDAKTRQVLFMSLAESAKRAGNALDGNAIERLSRIAAGEKDATVRSAAAAALGALNVKSNQASALILGQSK